MKTTLGQLHRWIIGSKLTADASFDGVSTDTRLAGAGNLFVALKGDNFDAHDFLADLPKKGVAAVVAERIPENYPLPALIVADTRLALGEMARQWRRNFSIPVIGVAGSNGKTTVKEMIATILKTAFGDEGRLATSGNFNNDIGVPLTIFRMNENHRAAVIELGMNHVGEMAYLTDIAQPTVGLVNNAQREHQEFMQTVLAVAEENGTVIRSLPENGTAVFPVDEPYSDLWARYAGSRQIRTFGLERDADISGRYENEHGGTSVVMESEGESYPVRLATSGRHNVRNALAAAACARSAGVDWKTIVKGLETFAPVHGRLEKKNAFNGALLIDDTYNANPDSVRAAIDVLAELSGKGIFVLGDMGEVGNDGERFHVEVGEYARERQIGHLFTFGEMARFASTAFGNNGRHFDDMAEMNAVLEQLLEPDMTVLVKGSRFMKMERVVNQLMDKKNKEGS